MVIRVTYIFLLTSAAMLAGCGGMRSSDPKSKSGDLKSSVQHIVIMMQENRSFDHYFGKLNDYRASKGLPQDVDGIPANVSLPIWGGLEMVSPFHLQTKCLDMLSPSWLETHYSFNLRNPASDIATMDGFVAMAGGYAAHEGLHDAAGRRAIGYFTEEDIPFYYFMATRFATSDRFFAPAPSRTPPNKLYLLSATSHGFVYAPPPGTGFPQKSIFQLLEENGITWRVYLSDVEHWTPGTPGGNMGYFWGFASQHGDNFAPATQFATDAQGDLLAQVSFIENSVKSDEHPTAGNIQIGAAYVESFITALMNSPAWKSSVLFLTWDEAGGFYDHVPPMTAVSPDGIPPRDLGPSDPPGDFTRTHFRVPLLVVSPFTKPGYVSHTAADYTAFLKFIETRFGLPSLTKRDAAQPDLTEFFDWSAPNLTPPTPPAQPTSGPCYYDRLP